MLKNISKLEVKIGERLYHFICDSDSPLGEVHDAVAKMKDFVVNMIVEQQNKDNENKPAVEANDSK